MEALTEQWTMLSGVLIAPLIDKVKKRFPNSDIPVLWWGIQVGLSVGLAFLLNWLMGAGASTKDLLSLALGTAVVATGAHAAMKTPKKLNP